MTGPKLHDRRNWVSSLPPDPMTDHSESANKSWGGVHTGKRQTLRGTDLVLRLSRIILLILHSLWKGQCGQGEPLSTRCLGLRNGPLCLLHCKYWFQVLKFEMQLYSGPSLEPNNSQRIHKSHWNYNYIYLDETAQKMWKFGLNGALCHFGK